MFPSQDLALTGRSDFIGFDSTLSLEIPLFKGLHRVVYAFSFAPFYAQN
jgi:hypothetical protein